MKNAMRPAIVLFVALTIITGLLYPLIVTAVSQTVFRHQANGSLIELDGKIVGSELIGQQFDAPRYFWGRLSATTPNPYNAGSSGGSNLGPTNPALADAVKARIAALHAADPSNDAAVPVDLVTSSGSGLDPHISPAAPRIRSHAWRGRAGCPSRKSMRSSSRRRPRAHSASSGNRR